jgi:hypothetical protein
LANVGRVLGVERADRVITKICEINSGSKETITRCQAKIAVEDLFHPGFWASLSRVSRRAAHVLSLRNYRRLSRRQSKWIFPRFRPAKGLRSLELSTPGD